MMEAVSSTDYREPPPKRRQIAVKSEIYVPDYIVLHPTSQPSSFSSPWEPEISIYFYIMIFILIKFLRDSLSQHVSILQDRYLSLSQIFSFPVSNH
jgi:hypothetical protein